MKKIIVLVLTIVLAISLCACGGKDNKSDSKDNEGINVEKKLFDVEVTLPAMFFTDTTPEEITAAAKEKGFYECTVNDDGSVTYKMSTAQHKEMLKEVADRIQESIDSVMNDATMYQSFQEIKHNDDMSQFDIIVDKNSFGLFDSIAAMMFYIDGALYQTLSGKATDAIDVIVNFVDSATGEIINTASYKNWIEGQQQ